jgi:phosphohistidine phosphatase
LKRLVLLRHAKSSWRDSELADHERPLSGRGERDAPRMGARLRHRGVAPDLVLTSHAQRALRTATVVARELDFPQARIGVVPRLYLATPKQILDVVASQAEDLQSILLVGHNPGLTELVNRLRPDAHLANVPTAGAVALEFDTERWSDLERAPGRLAFFDYPKNTEPVRGE